MNSWLIWRIYIKSEIFQDEKPFPQFLNNFTQKNQNNINLNTNFLKEALVQIDQKGNILLSSFFQTGIACFSLRVELRSTVIMDAQWRQVQKSSGGFVFPDVIWTTRRCAFIMPLVIFLQLTE
jgi:hypothetical protein